MAQITIQLTDACAGGNHLTFTATGDKTGTLKTDLQTISEPISVEEVESFVKVAIRLAKVGRTLNQTKNLLQTGITITI